MENPAINLMSPYAFPYRPCFLDRDESFLYPVIFILSGLYAVYGGGLVPVAVLITGILKRQKGDVLANTVGFVGTRKNTPFSLNVEY